MGKTLLHFWGVFQFTQVQPLPSPHKQSWTYVSRIFSLFQLCMGEGEGELEENFEKEALFYEGTEKWQEHINIALLYQGLLSMIVGILINTNLSWREHIDLVALKISKTWGMESSSLCFPCSPVFLVPLIPSVPLIPQSILTHYDKSVFSVLSRLTIEVSALGDFIVLFQATLVS